MTLHYFLFRNNMSEQSGRSKYQACRVSFALYNDKLCSNGTEE